MDRTGERDRAELLRLSDALSYLRKVPIATRLGDGDAHAALALVSEAAALHGVQPFERVTLERLLRMIPADRVGYFEYGDRGTSDTFFLDEPTKDLSGWDPEIVSATVDSWPLRDQCAQPARPAVKLSDFLSRSAIRRNPWYWEVMRPCGIEHELKVWLPAPVGVVRGFFLVRAKLHRDFDERDRGVLELLRPHLAHIRERWGARRKPSILTRREAEVLELVALGLTNGEIAIRLFISQGTVRRHLQNVFEKLEVHTRTAAVARLQGVAATR